MRVTRQAMEGHRAAILEAAGRLFRRQGIDHVSVAEVTREAGMTHGAFYGHYASKAALAEASCRESMARAALKWRQRGAEARAAGQDGVHAIIDLYLTEQHRDSPESGCDVASLGQELTRRDPALHAALSDGVGGLTDALAGEIAARHPGAAPDACTRAALAAFALLTGGIVLARATLDPDRSRATLQAAAAAARQAAEPEWTESGASA